MEKETRGERKRKWEGNRRKEGEGREILKRETGVKGTESISVTFFSPATAIVENGGRCKTPACTDPYSACGAPSLMLSQASNLEQFTANKYLPAHSICN